MTDTNPSSLAEALKIYREKYGKDFPVDGRKFEKILKDMKPSKENK